MPDGSLRDAGLRRPRGRGSRRREHRVAPPARPERVADDALQPVPGSRGAGGSRRGCLREHRVNPRDHPGREVRPYARERRRLVVDVAHQQRHRRVGVVERMAAREQLVGDEARRVEVDLRGDLATADLLGRHVGRRADDLPGRGAEVGHAHLPDRLGDPEVGDLGVSVRGDEHVLGLEIAVHDPARSGLGQPAEHAVEHARDLGERQPPYERSQRAALEVLHRDERHALVLEVLDHRDDARVVQRPGDARLVEEAMRDRGVRDVDRVQLLERDLAVECRLAGEMDGGHPAAARRRGSRSVPQYGASPSPLPLKTPGGSVYSPTPRTA